LLGAEPPLDWSFDEEPPDEEPPEEGLPWDASLGAAVAPFAAAVRVELKSGEEAAVDDPVALVLAMERSLYSPRE
jgi:hypothetical protein